MSGFFGKFLLIKWKIITDFSISERDLSLNNQKFFFHLSYCSHLALTTQWRNNWMSIVIPFWRFGNHLKCRNARWHPVIFRLKLHVNKSTFALNRGKHQILWAKISIPNIFFGIIKLVHFLNFSRLISWLKVSTFKTY